MQTMPVRAASPEMEEIMKEAEEGWPPEESAARQAD